MQRLDGDEKIGLRLRRLDTGQQPLDRLRERVDAQVQVHHMVLQVIEAGMADHAALQSSTNLRRGCDFCWYITLPSA